MQQLLRQWVMRRRIEKLFCLKGGTDGLCAPG
jgi:hypothetical protein